MRVPTHSAPESNDSPATTAAGSGEEQERKMGAGSGMTGTWADHAERAGGMPPDHGRGGGTEIIIDPEALGYCTAALQAGHVREAIAIAQRARSPVAACDPTHLAPRIEYLLGRTPRLLGDCPTAILEPLHIAAALMELWGEQSLRQLVVVEGDLNYRLNAEGIIRSLHAHASFLLALDAYRDEGVRRVQIVGSGAAYSCMACLSREGEIFNIKQVPELPLEECRCGGPCPLAVISHA